MTGVRGPQGKVLGLPVLLLVMAGCSSDPDFPRGLTPAEHAQYFQITEGAHAVDCNTCHGAFDTFKQFDCVTCHASWQTNTIHNSVPDYAYDSPSCYSCHPSGANETFHHLGITNGCALCHDVGATFAALPVPGFTHPAMNGSDCSSCHFSTVSWSTIAPPNGLTADPAKDLVITALIPSYSGTIMSRVTPLTQTLPMPMAHDSLQVVAIANAACVNCHIDQPSGVYFPGLLHSSLANLGLTQPTSCLDCHATTVPSGLVGPLATSPARTPPSGEMKHDAVLWRNGAPTTTPAVPRECGVCHLSPSRTVPATWATGLSGTAPALFHTSLTAAGMAQPASCVDCHANSRPTQVLTSANAAVPAGVQFDHASGQALGDCVTCHGPGPGAPYFSWAGGQFHLPGGATPTTCLPCHAGQRPTSTAGWQSPNYAVSPFDYGTNANGVTHGGGRNCVVCHAGPGTGAWGSTQNWQGGHYAHPAATTTTCINCHMSQRPDLQPGTTPAEMAALLGFDHSTSGTGDCFGCHQATVAANRYVNYVNPASGRLPGGDWQGGAGYPGSTLISAPLMFITATEITLQRSSTTNLVTGTSSAQVTLQNAMLHISAALPPELNAGPTSNPDFSKCWHCHTNTGGTVTSYADGRFHSSLSSYSATPGGTVTPFPQPSNLCTDCHTQMRPDGVVQKAGSNLQPMDHAAQFTAPVTIGGRSVTSVSQVECAVCHGSPGNVWSDGVFHARIGAAVPQDCTVCHYTLMADATRSDLTSGTRYAMRHRSGQITFQNCQTCHAGALARATTTPLASTLWQGGAYHPSLGAQPTACAECHSISDPLPNASTQSSWTYTFLKGGTATNSGQWFNHGSNWVTGKDCAVCHRADAKTSGSAWSKATVFHVTGLSVTTCRECHGLTNGGGTTPGDRNNLPAGLTDSDMVTSASAGTGVPAGTLAQITHSDVNASSRDCRFCHTQVGRSTVVGIQGKEWAQATFHANFNATNPLVMNGTTGRCSNCHMNVKPGPTYTGQDHSMFTSTPGTTDCSSCHSFPGTGTPTAPNWRGAVGGVPMYINVGGFPISQPPASSIIIQTGIANLPHPTVGTTPCATCHTGGAGGKNAIAYDHASTLISSNCSSCHEAGSNLVGTVWNGSTTMSGGAGDTRPWTIVGLVPSFDTNLIPLTNGFQHFFRADCHECHRAPTGIVSATTGATYMARWRFNHDMRRMTNPATCNMCHGPPNNIPCSGCR